MSTKFYSRSESRVSNGFPRAHTPPRTAAGWCPLDLRHCARCSICKSQDLEELEARYLSGEPMRKLARDLAFSERAVRRHVAWFHLDLFRLAISIARDGPEVDRRLDVDMNTFWKAVDALTHLNRCDRVAGLWR